MHVSFELFMTQEFLGSFFFLYEPQYEEIPSRQLPQLPFNAPVSSARFPNQIPPEEKFAAYRLSYNFILNNVQFLIILLALLVVCGGAFALHWRE